MFDDSISSPLFDSKASYRGDDISTVEVDSTSSIKRICSRVYNGRYTANLRLEFNEGSPLMIFNKNDVRGDYVDQVQEIEEGYQIVGIYGRLENNYVRYLGFKVAKF